MRLLFDEDFNANVVRGLRRRVLSLDGVTVPEVGLSGKDDDGVLDYAIQDHRVVVSHDVNTMIATVTRRIEQGIPVPKAIFVSQSVPIGVAIDELALVVQLAEEKDFPSGMIFIPL